MENERPAFYTLKVQGARFYRIWQKWDIRRIVRPRTLPNYIYCIKLCYILNWAYSNV